MIACSGATLDEKNKKKKLYAFYSQIATTRLKTDVNEHSTKINMVTVRQRYCRRIQCQFVDCKNVRTCCDTNTHIDAETTIEKEEDEEREEE